jgi:hypothetical protein
MGEDGKMSPQNHLFGKSCNEFRQIMIGSRTINFLPLFKRSWKFNIHLSRIFITNMKIPALKPTEHIY